MQSLGTVTVFNLGSSTVITIPKSLNLKAGTKMNITKHGSTITLEAQQTKTIKDSLSLLKKLSGSLTNSTTLSPKAAKKVYDEEVYSRLLP